MKTQFEKSFSKDLSKILNQDLLSRIKSVIEEVENATTITNITNLRKIKGKTTYYRIRVGEYRIGITWELDIVTFVRVLPRKDIYKYFP